MDFSALLAKEIAKKKQVASKANTDGKSKKYVSQADLKRAEQQIIDDKQRQLDEARSQKAEKLKRARQEEEREEESKRQRREEKKLLDKLAKETQEKEEKVESEIGGLEENKLNDEELTNAFRERGEPSLFFAEKRAHRVLRLHNLQLLDEQKRIDKEEDEKELAVDMEIQKSDIKTDSNKVYMQMRATVRTILSEWDQVLEDNTATTEEALEVFNQTQAYCQPLLLSLRKKSLPDQLYPKLAELLMHLQQHRYREANDIYIKISIGNATWPIGVTAVGIHARSSRERITGYGNEKDSSIQIAHIMSDDATRKWLIAIKRFLTFAEGHLNNKSFKS